MMRIDPHPRDHLPGIVVALVAGLHKGMQAAMPVNDDYQHLAYARQVLAGDVPLRDFWDISTTLQHGVSAVSQLLFGQRLLSEAIVVGVATAVAVYLVFRVLQQATGSTLVATLCAALFVVAGPRVYAYPKWIVYALAAWLWWSNVWWPSTRKAVAAGLSIAAAFYWRHDHGVLVATGVVLGMFAAHGFSRAALRQTALAGVVAFAAVLPYLVFAAVTLGPLSFVRLELTTLVDEHANTRAELRWPLRASNDLIRGEPAEAYAPVLTVRWKDSASPESRAAALAKYGLTPITASGSQAQQVRLSSRSIDSLRALIADPLIEDTAGVERGRGAFSWAQWPAWDRLRFRFAWLRFSLLPGIDQQIAAGAAAAMIVHAMPLLAALLAGPTLRRLLPPAVTPRALLLFAAFAVLVNFGLLRQPYESRVAEVLVFTTILLGVLLAVVLRRGYPALVRWPLRATALVLITLVAKSLATAGGVGNPVGWVMAEAESLARGETSPWREVAARLGASPPSRFWDGRHAHVTIRLAEYARRCTAPSDRLLVLWYAPEIHYNADRLMASRHLYFFAAFRDLEDEQRRELEKVRRFSPPLVLANRNNYAAAVEAFPGLMRYIEDNYVTATAFDEEGDRYSILVRKDGPSPTKDTATGWPCWYS